MLQKFISTFIIILIPIGIIPAANVYAKSISEKKGYPTRIYVTNEIVVPATPLETQNGIKLLEAINKAQKANVSDPIVIKLESGSFNIRDEKLNIPNFVRIQGAGETMTKIIFSSPVGVDMGDQSEIRDLTLQSSAGNTNQSIIGISIPKKTKANINNVAVLIPTIRSDVKAIGNYGTVAIENSKFDLTGNKGKASSTVINISGIMEIRNSALISASNRDLATNNSGNIGINNSKLDGNTDQLVLVANVVHSYTSNYIPIP